MAFINNNAFEISVTPSRKRKRDGDLDIEQQTDNKTTAGAAAIESATAAGITNGGFTSTSTPKNENTSSKFLETFGRSSNHKKISNDKENDVFVGMEVKSIAELATGIAIGTAAVSETESQENIQESPYEVVRKPPKKKKKEFGCGEGACFTNPALNLDVPDIRFNPYEVKRVSPPKDPKESNRNCFINPGLNIRAEDSVINPYEISRVKTYQNIQNGIENPALEQPRIYTLGIPFTPNVGCRLNFDKMLFEKSSGSNMLTDKVIFTSTKSKIAPVKLSHTRETFIRRSLPIIKEETVDIGKELDSYQLELENSINEAKLKKTNYGSAAGKPILSNIAESNLEDSENLTDISGIEILNEVEPKTPSLLSNSPETLFSGSKKTKKSISLDELNCRKKPTLHDFNDSSVEDSGDDDFDFKEPAPFVRAYRKPDNNIQPQCDTISKSLSDDKLSDEKTKPKSKSNQITGVIRRSIRRLIHSNSKPEKTESKSSNLDVANGKPNSESHHIFESIRHSLRRKPKKENQVIEQQDTEEKIPSLSSLDMTLSERQIFRSNTEEFELDRKVSIRGSFRKTTRDMKNNVMKSVFKKNIEEYKFEN